MLTRQDRHQNTKPLIANDHNQRHPACSGRPVGAIHFRCRTAIRVTQGTDKTISDGRFNVYVVYVTRGGKQGNAFFHRRSAEVNCVLSFVVDGTVHSDNTKISLKGQQTALPSEPQKLYESPANTFAKEGIPIRSNQGADGQLIAG